MRNGNLRFLAESGFGKTLRRRTAALLSAAILLMAPVSAFAAAADSADGAGSPDQTPTEEKLLTEVYEMLRDYHVSGTTGQALTEAAIEGMIKSLDDPYTEYMTAKDYKDFMDYLEQNYVGIGVRIGEGDEGLFAAEVFTGSPAEKAGIKKGDIFIGVNGSSVKGIESDELVKRIVGEAGTSVSIQVLRGTTKLSFTMVRAQIVRPVVKTKWFSGSIGYIELSTFSDNADDLFAEQLEAMKKQGMKGLILDLRNNSGGYLGTAMNIAKQFIDKGTLMNTKSRGEPAKTMELEGGQTLDVPVTVLVNEFSASASEVLTGALQDYGKAVVVGTKTYGKGCVQTTVPVTGGGYLKLTIEDYYTPKMRPVNHVGLQPDRYVEGEAAQVIEALRVLGASDYRLRFENHTVSVNGASFDDSTRILKEGQMPYIPSRMVAAMLGKSVSWNSKTKELTMSAKSGKQVYRLMSKDVIVKGGTCFISLEKVRKLNTGFVFSHNGSRLTLYAGKVR